MQIYSEEQVRTTLGIVFLLDCEEKMKNSMKKEILYVLSLLTQLGVSFLFPILVMIYLSKYLEECYGFSHSGMILFLLIGLCAGIFNVYKLLRRFMK